MKLFDFNIYTGSLIDIFSCKGQQCIINTINPHSYIISLSDFYFSTALASSDILLPDGSGIVFASKILNGKKIDKITGPSALYFSLDFFDKKPTKIYFLGATEETLEKIENKIKENYSNIKVKTFSPSFSPKLSDHETQKIIIDINDFDPDLLCVGMTAPKQEKWIYENKNELPCCYIMAVGAAFDWFSEVKTPPSKISTALHLAWLERFVREPVRMFPRMKSMFIYIYIVLSIKVITYIENT